MVKVRLQQKWLFNMQKIQIQEIEEKVWIC